MAISFSTWLQTLISLVLTNQHSTNQVKMALLDVLGVVAGVMGFWSFGDNMFPQQKDMYSNYKVFVGIDGTGKPGDSGECCLVDAGGSISYSKVFDNWGMEIGRGGQFPKLKSGSDEVRRSQSGPVEGGHLTILTRNGLRLTMGTVDHHHVAECPSAGGHRRALRRQRRHLHRGDRRHAPRRQ